jgi:hypothetical protein
MELSTAYFAGGWSGSIPCHAPRIVDSLVESLALSASGLLGQIGAAVGGKFPAVLEGAREGRARIAGFGELARVVVGCVAFALVPLDSLFGTRDAPNEDFADGVENIGGKRGDLARRRAGNADKDVAKARNRNDHNIVPTLQRIPRVATVAGGGDAVRVLGEEHDPPRANPQIRETGNREVRAVGEDRRAFKIEVAVIGAAEVLTLLRPNVRDHRIVKDRPSALAAIVARFGLRAPSGVTVSEPHDPRLQSVALVNKYRSDARNVLIKSSLYYNVVNRQDITIKMPCILIESECLPKNLGARNTNAGGLHGQVPGPALDEPSLQ